MLHESHACLTCPSPVTNGADLFPLLSPSPQQPTVNTTPSRCYGNPHKQIETQMLGMKETPTSSCTAMAMSKCIKKGRESRDGKGMKVNLATRQVAFLAC